MSFVHKRSAPDAFTGSDNPYCHIPHIKLQGNGNQHLAVPGNPSHKPSPTEALAFKFGSTFTQGTGGRGAFPGTRRQRADWGFDLNIIFPFSRINVGRRLVLPGRLLADRPGPHRLRAGLLLPAPEDGGRDDQPGVFQDRAARPVARGPVHQRGHAPGADVRRHRAFHLLTRKSPCGICTRTVERPGRALRENVHEVRDLHGNAGHTAGRITTSATARRWRGRAGRRSWVTTCS